MSIRGRVRCRCIETGRALPPPVALEFDEHGRLRPADALAARWEAFWAWRRSACDHPDMNLFDGTLSWYNVRLIREALDDDATSYPVLLESIPTWNGHWRSIACSCGLRWGAGCHPARSTRMVLVVGCRAGRPERAWHLVRMDP